MHHAGYRDWREHCVAGSGVSRQQRTRENEEESSSRYFSIDCDFTTRDGTLGFNYDFSEEEIGGEASVLVCPDHQYNGIRAMPADQKGAVESSVGWVTETIAEARCSGTKVMIK